MTQVVVAAIAALVASVIFNVIAYFAAMRTIRKQREEMFPELYKTDEDN